MDDLLDFADGDLGGPFHHDPMLGAVQVLLQRQRAARGDQALDVEVFAGVDQPATLPSQS
jgi:hypothetical protein